MRLIRPKIVFRHSLLLLQKEKVRYIVIHHAQAERATWEDIHQWHLKRGWAGAGYHEYITKNGDVFILRGKWQRVHAKGYNKVSYGICLEGNYHKEKELSVLQMKSLMIRILVKRAEFPSAKVVLHRQLCDTDCPGQFFPRLKY